MENFWNFKILYILERIYFNPLLTKSKHILDRIYKRNFYKLLKQNDCNIPSSKIIVHNINLNLSKGDKNPIEYVSFYNSNDSDKKFNIKAKEASGLVPEICNEFISRKYLKNS